MLGIPLEVVTVEADESIGQGEAPDVYVERVAALKHALVRKELSRRAIDHRGVLTADTVVALGEKILTKPTSKEQAREMIGELTGRSHRVLSCYVISDASGEKQVKRTVETEVVMRTASTRELDAYARGGEGLDKAGGYGIQGQASLFVLAVHGSYHNVVGLPVGQVSVDLAELGIWEFS